MSLVANRIRGLPDDTHDPWPTHYLLNTPREIEALAKTAGFSHCELELFEAQPSYLVFSMVPFLAGVAYERLVNRFGFLAGFRASIFGRLVR